MAEPTVGRPRAVIKVFRSFVVYYEASENLDLFLELP